MEPLSLRLQLWYVATKTTWILCYLIVCVISIAMLFLIRFKQDKFGYMNYDIDYTVQGITFPTTPQNQIFPSNGSIIKIPNCIWLIVCVLIIVGWNVLLIKMIAWPSSYQVRTGDDLNKHNFRLVGGPFSNVSVYENTKVKYSPEKYEKKTVQKFPMEMRNIVIYYTYVCFFSFPFV